MSTAIAERTSQVDDELLGLAHRLRTRALDLRVQAAALDPVLATTWKRRAAELELEAWIAEVQSGAPVDALDVAA